MKRRIRSNESQRRGVTVVEMATVLPVIMVVFWGFWEWSRVEMIRQAAATAAYEAARLGVIPGTTTAEVEAKAHAKLAPYSVNDAVVTPTLDTPNNRCRVDISIPLANNLWGAGKIFPGKSINSKFDLRLEE